jgi:hypothetical protein
MFLFAQVLLALTLVLGSQTTFAGDRTLTLVGVYNRSSVAFELDTNSPYFFGDNTLVDATVNYGVLLETPMQGKWGFETGLIFLQRGFQVPTNVGSSDEDVYRWKSFYVPMVGRFHPTSIFTGSIGLYLDQAVGDVAHFKNSDPEEVSYRTMKESGYRSLDWGMTYSAGLTLDLNSATRLLLELRFNESWTNLMDTSLPNVDKREKGKIQETQFYLGLII